MKIRFWVVGDNKWRREVEAELTEGKTHELFYLRKNREYIVEIENEGKTTSLHLKDEI